MMASPPPVQPKGAPYAAAVPVPDPCPPTTHPETERPLRNPIVQWKEHTHTPMSRIRVALVGVVAAGLLLMSVGVARADNVQQINSLTAVQADGEARYQLTATNANGQGGDGEAGCNATPSSPAVVTIVTPPGVTATPSELTFTSCQ